MPGSEEIVDAGPRRENEIGGGREIEVDTVFYTHQEIVTCTVLSATDRAVERLME